MKTTSILVKWKKNAKVTGYEIKYVTGTTSKSLKVKGNATVSKKLTKLTKGKTYKISIRGYKTAGGTTSYGNWSTAKSVKVAK